MLNVKQLNASDLASIARLLSMDAQEVKTSVGRDLANGLPAGLAIEQLNRARKLESIASSIRTLCHGKQTDGALTGEVKQVATARDAYVADCERFNVSPVIRNGFHELQASE